MPFKPDTTRTPVRSQHLTLNAAVLHEIETARAAGEMDGGSGSRCYVCCESESKKLVNALLAAGLTNREITECCEAINARRRANNDNRIIGAKQVWLHRRSHFHIDKPAMAAYREIMERRADEANQDFINGIGHAITPYAVMETVMVKGYQHVTAEETEISTAEAMKAATELHDMTKSDASTRRMSELLYQMDKIIAAAQEFVPPELHEAFLARVEGHAHSVGPMKVLIDHSEPPPVPLREFSPSTKVDEDDVFE